MDHLVRMPTSNGTPNPIGGASRDDEPSPTPDNPWLCAYPCQVPGHSDIVKLLWDGRSFSLPESYANDPTYGRVDFDYVPPLE